MIREYKTIHGEFTLELHNNILTAKFSGALNIKTAVAFKRAISELAGPLNGAKWGYLSLSEQGQAATPDAEELLVECVQLCWSLGCIAGAYVLGSNLAITQLDRVFKKAGLASGAEGKVFATAEDAKRSIEQSLANL